MTIRFTIRDVLWLTALVGVAGAWMVDRRQLSEHHRRVEDHQADALIKGFELVEEGKKAWEARLREELNKPVP